MINSPEIHEFQDGSLCLSFNGGMDFDLVFASGAMRGDPALEKQRAVLEAIVESFKERDRLQGEVCMNLE